LHDATILQPIPCSHSLRMLKWTCNGGKIRVLTYKIGGYQNLKRRLGLDALVCASMVAASSPPGRLRVVGIRHASVTDGGRPARMASGGRHSRPSAGDVGRRRCSGGLRICSSTAGLSVGSFPFGLFGSRACLGWVKLSPMSSIVINRRHRVHSTLLSTTTKASMKFHLHWAIDHSLTGVQEQAFS
jgi:hypothetical protein